MQRCRDAVDGETAVYGAKQMWEGRPDARRCQRMSSRIHGVRPAAVHSFRRTDGLATPWAEIIPESASRRYFLIGPCCMNPCPPRLSCPTEAGTNHHRTPRRDARSAVPSTYLHTDPAYRLLPRFFWRKTASTALQTIPGCRGGWRWQRWLQDGTTLPVRPA
jgi:hypothetical protein